jgi:hypothetical protein
VLGAELAAADDAAADGAAGDDAAADGAADGDAELPAALVSKAVADGLFDVDATTLMTMSATNAMSPVSTLCRAGQDLRFCLLGDCCGGGDCGGCGGMADCCCHGGGWGVFCCGYHGSSCREYWP